MFGRADTYISVRFVQNVFYRVALGMLHDDRIVLGVLLARIFTKMNSK